MLGVDYHEDEMRAFLTSCKQYFAEFDAWAMDPKPDHYGVNNAMFSFISASVY